MSFDSTRCIHPPSSGPSEPQSLGAGDEDPAGDPAGPGEVQGPGGRGAEPAAEDGDGAAGNHISSHEIVEATMCVDRPCSNC